MESTKNAEEFMNRIDSEVQGINDILELEKRKRVEAEEQTKELSKKLDRINSGEEDISTLVSPVVMTKTNP